MAIKLGGMAAIGLGVATYFIFRRFKRDSFEAQTSASTADASPMRNELLEQHFREHPEGDPSVRIDRPVREVAVGTANANPNDRLVEIHSHRPDTRQESSASSRPAPGSKPAGYFPRSSRK